jgi:Serpin (serine protease inhibitor)
VGSNPTPSAGQRPFRGPLPRDHRVPVLRFGKVKDVTTAAMLRAPLARYAERLHAAIGDGHHVASPLGAWLLLALCAPAARGSGRDQLTDALGVEVDASAKFAAELLGSPHPLVASAAGIWNATRANTDDFLAWRAALPAAVETGELPKQEQLDAWANESTLGLIDAFPTRVTPETLVLLATALATRVAWDEPYDLAPASDLGPTSAWAPKLKQVLRTPAYGHVQFIASTEAAGDVAVHRAIASGGLVVTSVAAAPDVPALRVLATAYELATTALQSRDDVRRSLFDLPLGEGPLWKLTEEPTETIAPGERVERCSAVLPAWSAKNSHDLNLPSLGFPAAAAALAERMALSDYPFEARQSTVARYSREGFEAAALTSMAVGAAFMPTPHKALLRVAELRFGHPFAVVAVATERRVGFWHGLPVFGAWVASPDEASSDAP